MKDSNRVYSYKMDKKRSQIIQKIKKLLSLSNSENSYEAALAASRAKMLIQDYHIEEVELHKQIESKINFKVIQTDNKEPPLWQKELHRGLAEYLDGTAFLNNISGEFIFAGEEMNFEIYDYLFEHICSEIRKKSYFWQQKRVEFNMDHLNEEKLSYSFGIVTKVLERLKGLKKSQEEEIGIFKAVASKEIIFNKKKAINDFINKVNPKEHPLDDGQFYYEFYAKGFSDGEKITLNKGIKKGNDEAA